MPWPLPAVLAWAAAWGLHLALHAAGVPSPLALAAAAAVGAALALINPGPWRRVIAAAGFPLSAAALGGAADWPAWVWLALLAPLLLAYPLRAWRDAPFFPTPPDALTGLAGLIDRPTSVLDAGCGLGHGLRALRREWPAARLQGVEWSPLLSLAGQLLCPWARIRRGDLWVVPWSGIAVVYVFQRPESMARVWAKACREMAPGSWLVSLEFEVPGIAPVAELRRPGQRPVWIYRPDPANPRSTGPDGGR